MARKKSSLQKGEKAAKITSFAVALIGLAKGVVGVLSGSIALLAQAVDSLTDIFASLTVYLGLKFTQKEPTEKFPYGYYRAETFASLVVAALIVVSGIEILRQSVMRFLEPTVISYPHLALSVAAASIPLLYLLARHSRKTGEEINSQALVAQAKDFTLDMYSSFLVFVGVLSSSLRMPWIETLIGVLICVLILKAGVELGRDAVLTLMDAVLKPEHINKIRRAAKDVQGVIDVHDIKIRKSGPFCLGEMHMEVEEGLPIERAHAITEEVERKAKQECEELETLTIHMEPAQREEFRIAVPTEQDKGLKSKTNPHFGKALNFLLVDIDRGELKNWVAKPNPGVELTRKRGITTADFLKENGVNVLLVGELGEGPFHLLRNAYIDIYRLPEGFEVEEAVQAFLDGELEKVASAKKKP